VSGLTEATGIAYVGHATTNNAIPDPPVGALRAALFEPTPGQEIIRLYFADPSNPSETRMIQLPTKEQGQPDMRPASADLVLMGDGTWKAAGAGAQGPKGDKGDTGAQGVQGLTGPQGPAGIVGLASAVSWPGPVALAELTIVSMAIPASTVQVGTIYRIVMSGLISNGSQAGTVSAKARIGASGLLTEAIAANVTYGTRGSTATNLPFRATIDVGFASVGAAGTAQGSGEISAPNLTFTRNDSGVALPVAVNTTANRVLQGTLVCTGTGVLIVPAVAYIEKVRN
jgi:hypothetical protein